MARLKIAYIGGGSTRAPGTVASFIDQAENFAGSQIVLVDIDEAHLAVVRDLAKRIAAAQGADLNITATTDRLRALDACDVVLTSFRPGGFPARHMDESIPLRHGVIGQETQGPGGFFMALRSIGVIREIVRDMERRCPRAVLFNYTNPVNIVSEAVTHHTDISVVSLCEGPVIFPRMLARAADLNPDLIDAVMIGLNHGCWSIRHSYAGGDLMPLVRAAWERKRGDPTTSAFNLRLLELASTMDSVPASYFLYYYFQSEVLAELQAKGVTRAEEIMAAVPDYWEHYRRQAGEERPALEPARSRGGINELELAIDVIDAMFNDRGEVWPVNVPNRGAIPDFPDDRVVEVPGRVDRRGIEPLPQDSLPRQVVGLVQMLGEYQSLAARVAWEGTRREAIQALAANPLVLSPSRAAAIYNEMSHALRDFLPARLTQ